ncbi:NAD(P)-binding protein [Mycena amicta]|nr:NAD(P)-binding protein [Mycena amicta]
MTITQEVSAPLVAVVGATGAQGGSVVLALAESDKAYRIRAFTRDASKPAAKALADKGAEIVVVSLTVENKDAVFKAFEGADFVFMVTNWAEHGDPPRETTEGKLMIDAAKAAGVKGIVWSGLPSIDALSGGKYKQVGHFESKARVSEYGRQSGVPFVDVQAGGYASNSLTFLRPTKIAPDVWATNLPIAPSVIMPVIDAELDYGLFVRKAIEAPVFPDKQTWATWGELISMEDQMKQLSEFTGKNVIFNQITPEVFAEGLKSAGTPPHILPAIKEVFTSVGEFGYYAKDTVHSQEGLGRKPRTWREFVQTADWSGVFV